MSSRPFKYFDTLETFTSKKISAIEDNTAYLNGNLTVVGTPEVLWEDICFIEAEQMVWTHGTIFVNNSYILQVIEDDEYVTSYALIQLNDKIDDLSNINLSYYVSKNELTQASYVKASALSSYVSYAFLSSQSYVTSNDISSLLSGDFVTYEYLSSQSYVKNSTLNDYVTKTQLSNQSYLTEHQDLSTYVSKSELSNQSYITATVLSNQGYLTSHQDLSTYVTKTELSNAGYLTSHQDLSTYVTKTELSNQSYVTQATLSNNTYAGYTYVYDAYSYIMGKISTLELASGGGGSGTSAEGGITAISFNGVAASITGSVATITAPINDPTVAIQIDEETYSFTLNQSTGYTINLGNVLREHQSLDTYVSKTELSAQSYLTSIPNTYATYAAISAMSYVTQTQLDNAGYITSGLPAVTSSDNGKMLMVVNGSWTLVTPATLYSGNATPSNSNGNNGDLYIQS